jgi:hypothetical protein
MWAVETGSSVGSSYVDALAYAVSSCVTERKMRFTGITILRVENGKIAEEVGLDDGVTVLQQLGLLKAA